MPICSVVSTTSFPFALSSSHLANEDSRLLSCRRCCWTEAPRHAWVIVSRIQASGLATDSRTDVDLTCVPRLHVDTPVRYLSTLRKDLMESFYGMLILILASWCRKVNVHFVRGPIVGRTFVSNCNPYIRIRMIITYYLLRYFSLRSCN